MSLMIRQYNNEMSLTNAYEQSLKLIVSIFNGNHSCNTRETLQALNLSFPCISLLNIFLNLIQRHLSSLKHQNKSQPKVQMFPHKFEPKQNLNRKVGLALGCSNENFMCSNKHSLQQLFVTSCCCLASFKVPFIQLLALFKAHLLYTSLSCPKHSLSCSRHPSRSSLLALT